jgi:regulator of replication initiation timing
MGPNYEYKKMELQALLKQIADGKNTLLSISENESEKLEYKRDHLKEESKQIESQRNSLKKDIESQKDSLNQYVDALNKLYDQKTKGFPWLAKAYADYQYLKDLKKADYIENKKHPAIKGAEQVRIIAGQRRVAEELYRTIKYQLDYYENLFPWLTDFKEEDVDDLLIQILQKQAKGGEDVDELDDPAKKWLSPGEYS